MTEAIAYRRVSTETQLDGLGLDLQDDAIADLCRAEGLDLAATYTDEGICGAENIDVRLELGKALDHLNAHPGTVLILPRLDRLARDLIVQEQLLAEAWRAGATVLSCSPTERLYCQPDNPDDPARTLIRQVLGAVAAYERAMIRLRMTKGRRRLIAVQGYAGGPQPYGWADEAEKAVLARVAALRAESRTWEQIAGELNSARRFKRNGKPWNRGEIHRAYTRSLSRRPG